VQYTPHDIAIEVGLSPQTVRAYLRERFPAHESQTWWRLDQSEYESVLGQLRAARALMFHQPRRVLHRSQLLIPLF